MVNSAMDGPVGLWTYDDVAEWSQTPRSHVERLVAKRLIPHLRIGRYVRFRREDVESYLNTVRVGSTCPADTNATVRNADGATGEVVA